MLDRSLHVDHFVPTERVSIKIVRSLVTTKNVAYLFQKLLMLRLSYLSVHLSLLFHLLNFFLRKFNLLSFLLLIFQLCFVCVLLIRDSLRLRFRVLVPSPLSTSSFSPFSTSSSLSILPDFVLDVIASYKLILSFPQEPPMVMTVSSLPSQFF